MEIRVAAEMTAVMDTGIRVDRRLVALLGLNDASVIIVFMVMYLCLPVPATFYTLLPPILLTGGCSGGGGNRG